MNVYTISYQAVTKKLDIILKFFMKVKNFPSSKKHTNSYLEMADSVLSTLDHGVDILCKLDSSRKHQEKEYGIKMTTEEDMMYQDNCVPAVVEGDAVCSRNVYTAGVDSKWLKAAQARQLLLEKKLYYGKRRQWRLAMQAEQSRVLVGDEAKKQINETLPMEDTPEKDSEANTNFVPPDSSAKASKRLDFNHNTEIPDIPVRVGYRSVDPRICQLLVDLESKFGIEARRSGKVLAYIAIVSTEVGSKRMG